MRVAASPAVLDALVWPDEVTVVRIAADDLLAVGATSADLGSDTAAIVEEERGFVGWWLSREELRDRVLHHIEWPLPQARPALAQGLIAGVPAKLWLSGKRTLLLCQAAYAHELEERLP